MEFSIANSEKNKWLDFRLRSRLKFHLPKTRAAQAAQTAQQKQHAADEAMKNEALRKEEVLRWKCTLAIAVTFIAITGYCWVGCAARDLVHWTGKQWDDFQSQFKAKKESPSRPPYASPPPIEPYIPPYERIPGGNPTSWRQFYDDQAQRRKTENEKQRLQDIYFAKLEIDRAQKAIDYCTHNIAQLELKLTDPFVSEIERSKLRETRDFQQRNLEDARLELRDSLNNLQQLEPVSPFGPPQEPPPRN